MTTTTTHIPLTWLAKQAYKGMKGKPYFKHFGKKRMTDLAEHFAEIEMQEAEAADWDKEADWQDVLKHADTAASLVFANSTAQSDSEIHSVIHVNERLALAAFLLRRDGPYGSPMMQRAMLAGCVTAETRLAVARIHADIRLDTALSQERGVDWHPDGEDAVWVAEQMDKALRILAW